jgi:hypothetical protein
MRQAQVIEQGYATSSLYSYWFSTRADAAQALLAVKTLGRDPSGSEVIAATDNLKTLLAFQSTFKDQPDAASEALRCIANALLLIESARSTFLEKAVDGGDTCAAMLEASLSTVCF